MYTFSVNLPVSIFCLKTQLWNRGRHRKSLSSLPTPNRHVWEHPLILMTKHMEIHLFRGSHAKPKSSPHGICSRELMVPWAQSSYWDYNTHSGWVSVDSGGFPTDQVEHEVEATGTEQQWTLLMCPLRLCTPTSLPEPASLGRSRLQAFLRLVPARGKPGRTSRNCQQLDKGLPCARIFCLSQAKTGNNVVTSIPLHLKGLYIYGLFSPLEVHWRSRSPVVVTQCCHLMGETFVAAWVHTVEGQRSQKFTSPLKCLALILTQVTFLPQLIREN